MLQVSVLIWYASSKARLFPEGHSMKTERAASASGACESQRTQKNIYGTGITVRGKEAHSESFNILFFKHEYKYNFMQGSPSSNSGVIQVSLKCLTFEASFNLKKDARIYFSQADWAEYCPWLYFRSPSNYSFSPLIWFIHLSKHHFKANCMACPAVWLIRQLGALEFCSL